MATSHRPGGPQTASHIASRVMWSRDVRATSRLLGAGLRTAVEASRRRLFSQAAELPRLADWCPAVGRASGRHRGLTSIPVCSIVGTASYPPGSRRRDFLPVRGHEPADWQSRWNRLRSSIGEQTVLPPVDLVRSADGYWVIDGHNRVALAVARGQLWIDADVVEIGDAGQMCS